MNHKLHHEFPMSNHTDRIIELQLFVKQYKNIHLALHLE